MLRGGPGDTGDPAGAGGGPGVDAGELTAGGDTGDPLAGEGRELRAALWPREASGGSSQWLEVGELGCP